MMMMILMMMMMDDDDHSFIADIYVAPLQVERSQPHRGQIMLF